MTRPRWQHHGFLEFVVTTVPRSNTHGHDDVPIAILVIAVFRPHLACRLLVLELQPDLAFVSYGLEEVQHVGRIEADNQGIEVVRSLDRILRFAGIRRRRGDLELILFHADADGSGTLVGELGDTLDGSRELGSANHNELVVVPRHDGFVVRELTAELPAGQRTMADPEEERVLVVSEFQKLLVARRQERLQLAQSFARDQGSSFLR